MKVETELELVNAIVRDLRSRGLKVAKDVANIYRCADIVMEDQDGVVWVIECKLSAISRALKQLEIHKLSADRVAVAIPFRRTRQSTIDRLNKAGAGLMYLMPDGSTEIAAPPQVHGMVWKTARQQLLQTLEKVAT